jgi:hypothetical protein
MSPCAASNAYQEQLGSFFTAVFVVFVIGWGQGYQLWHRCRRYMIYW